MRTCGRPRPAGLAAAAMLAAVLASAPLAPAAPKAEPQTRPSTGRMKAYPTKYYVIYTDLTGDIVREAEARMTAMAEEYHRRTKGFAGVIRTRMPFLLYGTEAAYLAGGGQPGSAGLYTGRNLMAVAEPGSGDYLWHIIQHEGFHQFAHMVIRGPLPVWVNEGLAEYFGEGIWTGEGFVTGVVPPSQLKRVQAFIRQEKMVPFLDMLTMDDRDWSDSVGGDQAQIHYDQAWSMVHFLVHAEDGKYRGSFDGFITDIARGQDWKASFQRRFGRNVKAFEKRYSDWWLAQPADGTDDLYARAVVETMTGFLARAASQGQSFKTAEEFFREARARRLKASPKQWLPPGLLERMLLEVRKLSEWSLDTAERFPKLILKRPAGKTFTGTFTHSAGMAYRVKVGENDEC